MRLMSFRHGGRTSWGGVVDGGVVDLAAASGERWPTLRSMLLDQALEDAAVLLGGASAPIPIEDIGYLPLIPDAEKILCVGLNYEAHRKETGRPKTDHPVIFTRYADAQVGHCEPLVVPRHSEKLDYEGEVAVVIGRGGRDIPAEEALGHVAGYSCYHDGSVRDYQSHTTQFTPGKNFPGTGGFGPCLVTTDDVPDPRALVLTTRLNGVEVQHAGLDDLTFSVEELIAYCSQWTVLRPGDVIVTGTPGGVGAARTPPLWLKPGDEVEVHVTGLGTLRHPVVAETA